MGIKGYRDLSEAEVNAINQLKEKEEGLLELLTAITDEDNARHVAIARTHIETGFMFAIKAIARPAPYYDR